MSGVIIGNLPGGGGGGSAGGGAAGDGDTGWGGGGSSGGTIWEVSKPTFSMNGRFIVEPYLSDRQIKTSTSTGGTGFARIEQKVAVKALRLLVDVRMETVLSSGANGGPLSNNIIPAGSLVFIREELLHTQPWAKQILENEYIGKFMIVAKEYVEFVRLA